MYGKIYRDIKKDFHTQKQKITVGVWEMEYTFFQKIVITNPDYPLLDDLNNAITFEDVARAYWNFQKRELIRKKIKFINEDIPTSCKCSNCTCK